MATVTFEKAQRWYPGMDKPAVPGIDLEIKDGEFMVLVGPSGCGKSTTLRMLAGLEEVNEGKIYIGDRDITRLPPKDRDIAMVFQNYALYPHMTVADNMAFSLKMAKMPAEERKKRVDEAARILNLHRVPRAQAQGPLGWSAPAGRDGSRDRPQAAGLLHGRAAVQPRREDAGATRTDIAKLQADLGVTTVYVTHDQVEAMTMGDRVAVMKDGYLQQVDTPLGLYDRPVNLFVAGFIGSPQMNLLSATAEEGKAKIGDYLVPVDEAAAHKMKGEIVVGVRPEAWRQVSADDGGLPVDGHRGRGARRGRLRLRHQRCRGRAQQRDRAGLRPGHRAQGRRDPRDHRPPPGARLRRRERGPPERVTSHARSGADTRDRFGSSALIGQTRVTYSRYEDLCDVEQLSSWGLPLSGQSSREPSSSAVAIWPPPHRRARRTQLLLRSRPQPRTRSRTRHDRQAAQHRPGADGRLLPGAAGHDAAGAADAGRGCDVPQRARGRLAVLPLARIDLHRPAAAPDRGADQHPERPGRPDRRLPRVHPQRQRRQVVQRRRCRRAATRPGSSAST